MAMEPGDKQFRTDSFNAEQSQQANASQERGAAALGQGVAQGAQQYVQGKRWQAEQETKALQWQAEFTASERARAFQQTVESQKLDMERAYNHAQVADIEVRKQEALQRIQLQREMMANGSVAEQLRSAKLHNDTMEHQLAEAKKKQAAIDSGGIEMSAAILPHIGQVTEDGNKWVIEGGMVKPVKATAQEMEQYKAKQSQKVLNDYGDFYANVFKTMSANAQMSGFKPDEITAAVQDIVDKVYGKGFAERQNGSRQQGYSQPSPSSSTGQASPPRTVGQSRDQERYNVVQSLNQPAWQVQLDDGSFKHITFDTLFPGGKPDNELIAQTQRTDSVLMKTGGGDSGVDRSGARMSVILPIVSDYNRLMSDMKAKGKTLSPEEMKQLRIIVNARLHGIPPSKLAQAFGDK